MTAITVVAMPPDDDDDIDGRYDYSRLPEEIRVPAMTAEGVVVQGLRSAVERVVEAGKALMWAKEVFPHGEYLPWVRACKLQPQQASKLVKAAEFANVVHVQHLEQVTDTATLFLLSADATTEDVREWFMERCAAGDPPSRKEVQERKRNSSEAGRQRTVIDEALKAFRLSDEARSLAANALRITTRQLMDELGADELPKGKQHVTDTATFVKDQEGWIKFPMQQPIDVPATATRTQADLFSDAPQTDEEIVSLAEGAARLGKKLPSFRISLTPSQLAKRGNPKGNGWAAYPHPARGKCILRKVP